MPNNYLITGPPRSGKTTVIQRTVSTLEDRGLSAGGVYCPEIRDGGERIGFEIVDVLTGESKRLAHVDEPGGPRVGEYRVNVANVDEICETAFGRALAEADYVVVDEIAPMETYSDEFTRGVRSALDAETPVVAAVHLRSDSGFVGEVKGRTDADLFEVTEETREDLPDRLARAILDAIETA